MRNLFFVKIVFHTKNIFAKKNFVKKLVWTKMLALKKLQTKKMSAKTCFDQKIRLVFCFVIIPPKKIVQRKIATFFGPYNNWA